MNISEKDLRKLIVKALVKSGLKVKDAELEVASLDNSELIFKASELGLNNTEDALVLETVVELTPETETDTINKPKLITVIGQFIGLRIFDKKNEDRTPKLNQAGDVEQVGVITIEPVFDENITVFIQPNQVKGFNFKEGEYLKLVIEQRRAHITQYENKKHEIVFHGKKGEPKGTIEYGFITGMPISEAKAQRVALNELPVELQESRRANLMATNR